MIKFLVCDILGFYEATLLRTSYDELRRLESGARAAVGPAPSAVAPDVRSVSIGASPDGVRVEMRSFPLHEVPPAVLPSIEAARRAVAEVMKSPGRVLRGAARPASRSFRVGEAPVFEISLSNVGRDELQTGNPLCAADPDWTGLTLEIARERTSGPVADSDTLSLLLGPQNVLALPGVVPPRGKLASLPPGGTLAFQVKRRILASPGIYRARLLYRAAPAEGDLTSIEGTLRIPLGTFEVVAGPGQKG